MPIKSVNCRATPKQGRRRVWSLDVTRALAATAVFLFHYGALPFGYLGVELFFLLSGFVLTLPSRHESIYQFVWARCVRLYPAYWVALSLTLSAMLLKGERPSALTVAANATMLPAFLGMPYIDGVYWSLTEEIIFYLLVGITGSYRGNRHPLFLAALMAFLCGGYAVLARSGAVQIGGNSKIEMVLKYFPFFSSGIAAATLFRKFGRNETQSTNTSVAAVSLCVLVPLLTALYKYSSHLSPSLSSYEGVAIGCVFALFYVLMTIACCEHRLAIVASRGSALRLIMALVRGVAFFGACTYPFYLLHERFAKTIAVLAGFAISGPLDLLVVFFGVAFISVAIHAAVEGHALERLKLSVRSE